MGYPCAWTLPDGVELGSRSQKPHCQPISPRDGAVIAYNRLAWIVRGRQPQIEDEIICSKPFRKGRMVVRSFQSEVCRKGGMTRGSQLRQSNCSHSQLRLLSRVGLRIGLIIPNRPGTFGGTITHRRTSYRHASLIGVRPL
jgi:hypothetical protein